MTDGKASKTPDNLLAALLEDDDAGDPKEPKTAEAIRELLAAWNMVDGSESTSASFGGQLSGQ
jgi:hypothetical protein